MTSTPDRPQPHPPQRPDAAVRRARRRPLGRRRPGHLLLHQRQRVPAADDGAVDRRGGRQARAFRTDPIGRGLRSLASVMMWVYADEESLAEVERLREMHSTLEAVDADGVRHTALSSGPWAWVLLTGVHAFTEGREVLRRRPTATRSSRCTRR